MDLEPDLDFAGVPPSFEPTDGPVLMQELQMAFRNRGLPLEAMRYDLTPTGIHYLVVHFDIPELDPGKWRLKIGGNVRSPRQLNLEDIRTLPRRTIPVTLECAGNGRGLLSPRPVSLPWLGEAIGTAEWTGVPLITLLHAAGLGPEVVEIVFRGADRGLQGGEDHTYSRSLSLAEANRPEILVAYEMNGRPLEPQHGFPLRLVVPGWYGMASVKWLTSIEAVAEPFDGFQQAVAYRYQNDAEDPGEPVNKIRVRALMVPPGIPDCLSRRRFVERGRVKVAGRAWSGEGPVEQVQFAVDGRWMNASLSGPLGDFAWRAWSIDWVATPGEHELACRATDAAGNAQPLEAPWNYQGMGNNSVQRVRVTVR